MLSVRCGRTPRPRSPTRRTTRTPTVDVTEHELERSHVFVLTPGRLRGPDQRSRVCGRSTPPPPGKPAGPRGEGEGARATARAHLLQRNQERDPDKLDSFVGTVQLAHEAGATINITYQTATNARYEPPRFMAVVRDDLDDLVAGERLDKRPLGHDPERAEHGPRSRPPEYKALYRVLDAELARAGFATTSGSWAAICSSSAAAATQPPPGGTTWSST